MSEQEIRKRLEDKLASSDVEERRQAAVDLGRAGKPAAPLLFRALGDRDWRVRKTAVEAVVALGGEDVVARLIETLNNDDNAGARNSAIEALVQIGGTAIPALLSALETPDTDVRKFIVDILGEIKDSRSLPFLITRLDDPDENIRVASAESLGKIRDGAAVEALAACLKRPEQEWLAYAAAEALGEIGDPRALDPLLAALSHSGLREPIIESLGKIGNAKTLGPLINGLVDPLRIVREASVSALATIYKKTAALERQPLVEITRTGMSDSAIDFLEEMLESGAQGPLRDAVILMLGIGGRASSLLKMLTLLSEEELEEPVKDALLLFDKNKASHLKVFLSSDNALVRRTVAEVLVDLAGKGAEDWLIPLLQDPNGHVRSAACLALGRLRSGNAVKPLLQLVSDEYVSVQETAMRALAQINDESMLDDLIGDYSTRPALLRKNIAYILGNFSCEKALEALLFAVKDEEPDVRNAAVRSLANMSGEKPLKALLFAISDDEPEVRMLAAEALSTRHAPETLPALGSLLEDKDLWVRAAAARGLGALGGEPAGKILTAYLTKDAIDIFLLSLVEALGTCVYPPAAQTLVGLSKHPDPEVRKNVLTALSHYAGDEVDRAVMERVTDPHWSVRKAAIAALKEKHDSRTESLLEIIARTDADMAVREAAKEALKK